jgi:hypothetical protein
MTLIKRMRISSTIPAIVNMFKVPGHMNDYEILSRGSAFPLQFEGRTRWLTSRHVTHPHLHLDTYYANDDVEWLKSVTSDMTRQHLEWRNTDGSTVVQTAKVRQVRGHKDLDVAEIQLEDTNSTNHVLGYELFEEQGGFDALVQHADELVFFGHNLNVNIDESTGDDLGYMIPNNESGVAKYVSGFRMLCETKKTLQMGMCGGPCLVNDKVIGMTEGILPGRSTDIGSPPKRVADVFPHHAVVMGSAALVEFLQQEKS